VFLFSNSANEEYTTTTDMYRANGIATINGARKVLGAHDVDVSKLVSRSCWSWYRRVSPSPLYAFLISHMPTVDMCT